MSGDDATKAKMGRPRLLTEQARAIAVRVDMDMRDDIDAMAEAVMGGNREKLLRKILADAIKTWKRPGRA